MDRNRKIKGLLILSIGSILFLFNAFSADRELKKVRKSAVAGTFYPGGKDELRQLVSDLLDSVPASSREGRLIALISPHAGYVYSGPVAAYSYAEVRKRPFKRVVVISPSHVEAFEGAAVYNGDGYETPLGIVPVDMEFARGLSEASGLIHYSDKGHRVGFGRGEHALEVQLPFLQVVLQDFKLVPIIMGEQSFKTCEVLSRALSELIRESDTLIVASSDLSHFHPYDEAIALDRQVTDAIKRRDYRILSENLAGRKWEACGGGPIVTALMAAEKLGATRAEILKYANSGDVPYGDKDRVVGYVSAAIYQDSDAPAADSDETTLSEEDRKELFRIARLSVTEIVRKGRSPRIAPPESEDLLRNAAVFVTLRKNGRLRGCVGSIVATESLYQAVARSAVNAAVNDRRFPPVSEAELDDLEYEISVLSPFRKISDVKQIEVGRHGLMLEKGPFRGLLLPQVATENRWDRKKFLENICLKAGLPRDSWKHPETELYVFSAEVLEEE